MNKNIKNFVDTDIFRSSVKLFNSVFLRVKNNEIDGKKTIGYGLLNNIYKCGEHAKLSYVNNKNNKKMKLKDMLMAKRYIMKAEFDLNIIVSCGLFQGSKKSNEDENVYINGGAEISMYLGELVMQLDNFIGSLEKGFTTEELDEIYSSIDI